MGGLNSTALCEARHGGDLALELVNHELRVRIRKGSGEALTPVSRDEFRLNGTRITFERDALVITNRGVEKLRLTKVSSGSS